jgi:hypothetical protein
VFFLIIKCDFLYLKEMMVPAWMIKINAILNDFSTGFWEYLLRFRIGLCYVNEMIWYFYFQLSVQYTNSFCVNRLFELFVNIMDLLVHKARIEGDLDTGIVDLKATVIELQGTQKVFIFLLNFWLPLFFVCYCIANLRLKINFL